MPDFDTKRLLTAVSAELSDIRLGVDSTGKLVGELLNLASADQRLAYLTRVQAFDVLSQRIDALSELAAALAADQPIDAAVAALPLAEMAERLRETSLRGEVPGNAAGSSGNAGDLLLFD